MLDIPTVVQHHSAVWLRTMSTQEATSPEMRERWLKPFLLSCR